MYIIELSSGRKFSLKYSERVGQHNLTLTQPNGSFAGHAEWKLAVPIMTLVDLQVIGRDNTFNVLHPCPGAGTLLLYHACLRAWTLGAQRLELHAVDGAQDFYHRYGLHIPVDSARRTAFRPSQSRFGARVQSLLSCIAPPQQSLDGHLNSSWLKNFEKRFVAGRRMGAMEAELSTVLHHYLAPRVQSQWQPIVGYA